MITRASLRAALLPWLLARCLLAIGFVLAEVVAHDTLPGASRPAELEHGLLSWDGSWYREIAEGGYGSLGEEAVRFFPLYPMLGRLLGLVLFGREGLALGMISNLAALGAAAVVRELVLAEVGQPRLADRATWLLMLFPPAFVLSFGYSESLFLLLALLAFKGLRGENWWIAGCAAMLAGATRPLGIFLLLPAAAEVWRRRGRISAAGGIAVVVAPAVGVASYLAYTWSRIGDALAPVRAQDPLRGDLVDPLTRLAEGIADLGGAERFGDGLHVPFALLAIGLAAMTFRFWPVSYGLYSAAVVVVALSAENLNSLERYMLNAFPLVLSLAVLARSETRERVIFALCSAGLVGMATLSLLGTYVP